LRFLAFKFEFESRADNSTISLGGDRDGGRERRDQNDKVNYVFLSAFSKPGFFE
jgi:hypothetical protein